ncbi:MAG: sensor histidine kinase [Pontibacterium sp.]
MIKKPVLWGILAVVLSVLLTLQVRTHALNWALDDLRLKGEARLLNTVIVFREAINKYHYLPFLISQNPDIKPLLRDPSLEKGEVISRYLEQINLVAQASQTMVLSAQGEALSFSGWRDQTAHYLQSYASAPYFKSAVDNERRVFLLSQEGLPLSFYLTAPIYDNAELNGIATVRVGLDKLSSSLQSLGTYYVSGPQGKVLLSNQPQWLELNQIQVLQSQPTFTLSEGVTLELVKEQGLGTGTNATEYVRQSVTLSDLGVRMVVLSPTQPAYRTRDNATMVAGVACFALLMLMMLMRERHLKNRSRGETRAAIAASERQQRAIINNAQVGLLVLDSSGRIDFVNSTLATQFELAPDNLVGTPLRQYLNYEDQADVKASLGSLTLAPQSFIAVVAAEVSVSAQRHYPALISIQRFETNERYLVTLIDITKRKNLEAQLHAINDQLEEKVLARTHALELAQKELVQSEKMAALGRMSSAMVHELNQPLTAIRTYVAICGQQVAKGAYEPLKQNLDVLNQLTQRMAQMTQQLKAFAFKKPAELSPVTLAPLVQQVALQMEPSLPEQVELRLNISPESQSLRVLGDSARLSQIISNLISNASDASKAALQQKLPVEESALVSEAPVVKSVLVQLATTKLGDQRALTLSVVDEGTGLNEDDIPHLFDPFFTTKPIGEGLGLGLAIVSSIVRDLGGELTAKNSLESPGAIFSVTLPLAETAVNTVN